MRVAAVGRVEHPEDIDLEPIEVPVIGYTVDHEEVEEIFSFRGVQPTGASIEVLRNINDDGNVPVKLILDFVDACLLGSDQEKWKEFVNDPDVYIEQDTLIELYKTIMEVYAARPTMPPSDSRSGRGNSKQTSQAAARKKASTGKKSRSR